jgi:hypothetical protein
MADDEEFNKELQSICPETPNLLTSRGYDEDEKRLLQDLHSPVKRDWNADSGEAPPHELGSPEKPSLQKANPPADHEGDACGEAETAQASEEADNGVGPWEVNGLTFDSNFDSGNLRQVELGSTNEQSNVDGLCASYKLWVKPDCWGTEFQTRHSTWFYFSIAGGKVGDVIEMKIQNMNKVPKLYEQGMRPVVRLQSERGWKRSAFWPKWEKKGGNVEVTFQHCFEASASGEVEPVFLAFTYPYAFVDVLRKLEGLDQLFIGHEQIYYHRELLTRSIEGRRVDLLTVSSHEGKTEEREQRIPGLFPHEKAIDREVIDRSPLDWVTKQGQAEEDGEERSIERPHVFEGKPVVFVSARVHPGELPAQFTFDGVLDFILSSQVSPSHLTLALSCLIHARCWANAGRTLRKREARMHSHPAPTHHV